MKVVIFAGGLGTRISEETEIKPKPMVEIGGKPILWHIMKIYEHHGFNEFIICLGYKGYVIKEYFMNYYLHNSDVTIELNNNNVQIHYSNTESFKVTLIDTGLNTKTAGRLKRIEKYIGDEDFMLTYGDGVSDVNLKELVEFHLNHQKIATVTSVQPEAKYGIMEINENHEIINFREKPQTGERWINGGFFVLKSTVFKYLLNPDIDNVMWEDTPLEDMAKDNQLMSYKHEGFWKCMDALRDKIELEEIWKEGSAKWKVWR